MKVDFDTVKVTKISDKVTRKRVTGEKLEIILYTVFCTPKMPYFSHKY